MLEAFKSLLDEIMLERDVDVVVYSMKCSFEVVRLLASLSRLLE